MILSLKSFTSLLETMSAGLQGSAAQIVDVSVGSIMRALLEASASIALWMQWLILQVLATTRAATSTGGDLDSWMADFSFSRLAGSPSSGIVTFGRYSVGLAASIPVGAVVKTNDSSISFAVVGDSTNPAWDGVSNYLLPSTLTNVAVPVQAQLPGAAGNVLANAVGMISTAIPGVDTVANALPMAGGADPESDIAFRGRFQLYINSRSLATRQAVGAAIEALRQGLRYTILENVNLAGQTAPGNFCVIVDDGTGTATDLLVSEVAAAVEVVRPLGSTFSVTRPAIVPVSVVLGLVAGPGGAAAALGALVQQAVAAWVGSLPMGGLLAVSKLEALAHATDSSVASVASATINGTSTDVQAPAGAIIELVSINVTVS